MPELKVTSSHLDRDAYLYIRQSTPRQVLENTESTQRQYALGDRAVAQGWSREQIHVIDCDLGKSGSQAAGRDGFQQLVNQVALGKAGMVLGLEVSRLARNSADWHRVDRAVCTDGHLDPG
jgi:DNA invertase Pin-like site-specific DNA recombinase